MTEHALTEVAPDVMQVSAAATSSSCAAASSTRGAGNEESSLRKDFEELCAASGTACLTFRVWSQWPCIRNKIGPPGSGALLTEAAAESIWRRVAAANVETGGYPDASTNGTVDVQGFIELAQVIKDEVKRATAIQCLVRARAARSSRNQKGADAKNTSNAIPGAVALAPFNPTPDSAIDQALDALEVGPDDVVYDLGCGDGRFLLAAAQRGATCVGAEYDSELVQRARDAAANLLAAGSINIIHGDAFDVDLTPATKLFVYLVPEGLKRMAPKLDETLRRGVPIASYTFSLPGWEPVQSFTPVAGSPECKVRLYRDVAGSCQAAADQAQ